VTKVKTRRTQNLKLSGVASRRSMRLSIAAVRRNCGGHAGAAGATVLRKLRLLRTTETAGPAKSRMLVRPRPVPGLLLEQPPWVLGSTVRQASTPLRRNPLPAASSGGKANKHGASHSKLGAMWSVRA